MLYIKYNNKLYYKQYKTVTEERYRLKTDFD